MWCFRSEKRCCFFFVSREFVLQSFPLCRRTQVWSSWGLSRRRADSTLGCELQSDEVCEDAAGRRRHLRPERGPARAQASWSPPGALPVRSGGRRGFQGGESTTDRWESGEGALGRVSIIETGGSEARRVLGLESSALTERCL